MSDKAKKALEEARKALAELKAKRLQASQGGNTKVTTKEGMPTEVQKSLRNFGVKSFEKLMEVNVADKKYSYLGKEKLEQVKNFKEAVDVAVIMSKLFKKDIKDLNFYEDELQFHMKAFGIDSGDEGYEWIPTMVSTSYLDEYNLDRKVSGLFMEVKMPSNPYKWPVLSNGAIARILGVATGATIEDTKNNTAQAIQFHIEGMRAEGIPIPDGEAISEYVTVG